MKPKATAEKTKPPRKQTLFMRVGLNGSRSVFLYRQSGGGFGFRVTGKNNEITCLGENYKTKQKLTKELSVLWPDGLPVGDISKLISGL